MRASRFRCVDDRGANDSYDGVLIVVDDDVIIDGVDLEDGDAAEVFLEGVYLISR